MSNASRPASALVSRLETTADYLAEQFENKRWARALAGGHIPDDDCEAITTRVWEGLGLVEMLREAAAALSRGGSSTGEAPDDVSRCAVCGWTLADSIDKGCVRGNCSLRPFPESAYSPSRAAKEYGPLLNLSRFRLSRFRNGGAAPSSSPPLPADYETNPRACRQCGLSLAACFRWRGGQTPQPCCDACNHEAAISDPSSHGVLVIDTSKTYERIHDTSETLPRVDPQAVALALGAAPSSPSLPSAALSETPAPPAHQRAARIAKAVFQEVPLSAAERLPDPDPFEAPSSQATPPAGSTPLDAFVSRIRAGREDLRVILGCPCEFCVTKRTKAASLPSMSPEVAASGSQGEGARRQAALVPLLDAAICEACGHLWCYHTSGGMCQGTRKGIECYCCLIPDAKDRARCEPAAPSSSPALSGQTNDDEKTATRSPSPDVIPATGSPRSPQPGDSHGWQLIETAPTNISVLVFIPNAEHYGVGIYRAIHVDMGTGRRWMTTGLHVGRDVGPDYQPTRWMPLPPSPVTQE